MCSQHYLNEATNIASSYSWLLDAFGGVVELAGAAGLAATFCLSLSLAVSSLCGVGRVLLITYNYSERQKEDVIQYHRKLSLAPARK